MNQEAGGASRRQRYVLLFFLVATAILAVTNSVVNPLFEPPDELQHYQFVRALLDSRQLPVQELDGSVTQFHQPPLYYLAGALLVSGLEDPEAIPARNPFWAYFAAGEVGDDNKNQFLNPPSQSFPYTGTALVMHSLRLWSVLLSLGTVTAVWFAGKWLWPSKPLMVAALLALAVLNPMFLYISGAVNNDNLVILCGAVILWLTLRGIEDEFSWTTTAVIGVTWSISLLSKITGLMLAALWGSALILISWNKRDWRLLISRLGGILGLVLLFAGWWVIRNLVLYGEPLAVERVLAVWGSRVQFGWSHIVPDLSYAWTTFWGRFGYGQVPLPRYIYWLLLLGTAVAGIGLAVGFRRVTEFTPWRSREKRIIFVLGAAVLTYIASLGYYILRTPTGANGRYVFPVLPAFAVLLVMGLTSWIKKSSDQRVLHGIIVAVMLALAIYTTAFFLPGTYDRPRKLTETQVLKQIDYPQQALWNNQIELLGVSFDKSEVRQGEEIEVTACWKANNLIDEDYALAIHLLDNEFHSYGQRDSYHGQGRYPTSYWQPGEMFCDSYEVTVSQEVDSPLVSSVAITLYKYGSGEKLPADVGTGGLIDIVPVGQVKLLPETGPPIASDTAPKLAAFEQGVSLVDYSWSALEVSPGDTITFTTQWRTSGPLEHSYSIFAHLLDESGQIVHQADGLPRRGAYPTTFWGENEVITDIRSFQIPAQAKSGSLTVNIGFYILESGSRLPRADGSDLPDSAQLPGPVIGGG